MLTGPDDLDRFDPAVAGMAILVAAHCLVAPWLPGGLGGNAAHAVGVLLLVGASLPAVIGGWMRHHENRGFGWAGAGWLGSLVARLGGGNGLSEAGEVVVTIGACGLLITAHQLNRSLLYWHDKS